MTAYQFTMASLRSASAARMLRGSVATSRTILPAARRFESTLTTQEKPTPSTPAVREENQPDYGAHFDKATSYVFFAEGMPRNSE